MNMNDFGPNFNRRSPQANGVLQPLHRLGVELGADTCGGLTFEAVLYIMIPMGRIQGGRWMVMVVRVIIDRKIKKGKESDFSRLLRELRTNAIPSKGYISGETLRALDDNHSYLVISTWQSLEDWRNWEKSPERKKTHSKIDRLLARPTRVKVYVNA